MDKSKEKRIPYSDTTIPKERSKADIEKLLMDTGIQDVQWTTYHGTSSLRFLWHLTVKGVEKEIMFQFTPPIITTQKRIWSERDQKTIKATVQLENTAYRLLWHYLKNKLEAVQWGMETIEKEFLSHAVVSLPNGQETTVGESIMGVLESVRSPALTYAPERKQTPIGRVIDQ
jgi:hypothetical protein